MEKNITNNITDIELIKRVKEEGSSEAFSVLLDRHGGLFTKVVNHHFHIVHVEANAKIEPTGQSFNLQDIIDDKETIFYDSILGYKEEFGQFNSWLWQQTRFYCLDLLNSKEKKTYQFDTTDALNAYIDSNFPTYDKRSYNEEMNIIFNLLSQHRDERLFKVFYAKIFLDKPYNTYHNIGKSLNISYEYARLLFEKAKAFLKSQNIVKELKFCLETV